MFGNGVHMASAEERSWAICDVVHLYGGLKPQKLIK